MQFNSIEFLFFFLPAFLTVYLLAPARAKSPILLLGSLLYYVLACSGSYWQLILLVGMTGLSYLAGLTLRKAGRGALLAVYLTFLAGILVFFKLYDGGRYLPVGMSFYLFQISAYLIDVFRGKTAPQSNLISYASQTVMFPKLLSGPLVSPESLRAQAQDCRPHFRRFHEGLQELILGLGLKVLLANKLSGLWGQAGSLGYENVSVPFAWMALSGYAMRLYFDFYGYSLMAMGLGKMLGYDLPRNFDDPYASKTVSEFYRRWHVTLGAWFREYVYIPLGGNRKGTIRTILNLAVVWLLTGLWHGVGGNYLLWAGILFVLIVNERLWMGRLMKRSHVISHVYLVFVILLSWVPFAIGDFGQMIAFFGRLFGVGGAVLNPMDYLSAGITYGPLLAAGVILATPIPRKIWEKCRNSTLADLFLLLIFWLVVYSVSTAAQDPFLYFQY